MGEAVALEFEAPGGEALELEWRSDRLARLDPGDGSGAPVWRLGGEVDWDEIESMRALSGRLDDGRLLVLAALVPRGAGGHGDGPVAAALGDEAGFEQLAQTLLSIEYGPDGQARRIGLELYPSPESMPMRIAGDSTATASGDEGGVQRRSTALDLRSAGARGVGVLDLLSRA